MARVVSRRRCRRLNDESGNNLIEAAIVMPLVLLVTFSVAEYGAIFYVNLALQNGVSQATRYAITGQVRAGDNRAGSIRAAMRNATPTLTIPDDAFTFEHMPPGGSSWQGGTGGPDAIEKVTVEYEWPIMTPLMRPLFDDDVVRFRVESAMKNESQIQL